MLKLGIIVLNFELLDVVFGNIIFLLKFKGKKVLLVMFICCYCLFVKYI